MVYFKELPVTGPESVPQSQLTVVKGRGEHILLVDDEKELLASAQQLLSGIGYRVKAYSDPRQAMERFRRAPEDFDLLVTDENMPKITGLQLVKAVHKLRPQLPVIICTGYSENLNQHTVDQMYLYGVVRKPFTLAEISRTISNVLTQQAH